MPELQVIAHHTMKEGEEQTVLALLVEQFDADE
jgi:hypothetical protein